MAKQEEQQVLRCDACRPTETAGPATLALYVAPGIFRDTDSDFSYGIPVCGFCGGLGNILEDEEFKKNVDRILKLRFEYCPTSGKEPSKEEKERLLSELMTAVKNHYTKYRTIAVDKCYAEQLFNSP